MASQQALKTIPGKGGFPRTPSQPELPSATHRLVETGQGIVIPAPTVILVVTSHFLRQRCLLLRHRFVAITAAPVCDLPDRATHSARQRYRLDRPIPGARLAPVQRE